MSKIVVLKSYCFGYDWTYDEDILIDLDKYSYFRIDYRLHSWHVIGFYYDRVLSKWFSDELSVHGVYFDDLVNFIVEVERLSEGRCRVSEFSAYHNSKEFHDEMFRLLKAIIQKRGD